MLTNDYLQAKEELSSGLFAVQMSDGGWTISDGPGTKLSKPDEMELAGYHLPVRFETEKSAIDAIIRGPDEFFDIAVDCGWVNHCIASGGSLCESYMHPPYD